MGSLALSLCHLAAGRVDAVCSLKPARSIDIAAAQLLVRERGFAIELFDDPPFAAAPLDLIGRSRVVAAASEALCAEIAERSGNVEGAAFAAPSCPGRSEHSLDIPPACLPRWPGSARARASPTPSRLRQPPPEQRACTLRLPAAFLAPAPRTISARMMNPIPLSSNAIPDDQPEQGDLLGHVGDVQRCRECGLGHPGVAGRVRDGLAVGVLQSGRLVARSLQDPSVLRRPRTGPSLHRSDRPTTRARGCACTWRSSARRCPFSIG